MTDSPTGTPDDQTNPGSSDLSEVFAVSAWLRGAGQASWLLVGMVLLLVGVIWLLSLTDVIVLPVLAAGIVAAVASPLVAWMNGNGLPRPLRRCRPARPRTLVGLACTFRQRKARSGA